MGTLTTTRVSTRVNTVLHDSANVGWTIAEHLLWMSDALREIHAHIPDALIKLTVKTLDAGTRQTLPADATLLMGVTRNMGTNGATPGAVPRLVKFTTLDAQLPNRNSDPTGVEVKLFAFDPVEKNVFHIYPPQPASNQGSLEMLYAASPSELTEGATLPLDDTWLPAITNYVLFRAWSKDAKHAANPGVAVAYYDAFVEQMKARAGGEGAAGANRTRS